MEPRFGAILRRCGFDAARRARRLLPVPRCLGPLSFAAKTSAAALALAVLCVTPCQASAPLTFTIQPSASQYGTTDAITLQLTLRLDPSATATATVCKYPVGVIHVLAVTRDGVRIKPSRSITRFGESPRLLYERFLVTLAPSESVTIPYKLWRGENTTTFIDDVDLSKETGKASKADVYSLLVPGVYTVRLEYRYSGPTGGRSDVFTQSLTSNVATFQLVQ